MRIRLSLAVSFCLLFVWGVTAQRDKVEAIEIGRHNTDLMPKGKEADGLPNDFVLRNNKIHALVSGAQPFRRANMTSLSPFVQQGCLYDLDLRGEDNDQITTFRPGGVFDYISFVTVADDGSTSGAAVVEAVRTAAKGDGLYTRHEYRLEQDWQYLRISSTYRNESEETKKITPSPIWKGLESEQTVGDIRIGDSIDPFDKRGYAVGPVKGTTLSEEEELPAGEEKKFQVRLAVADSPLAAYGVLVAAEAATGEVTGTVKDGDGEPAIHGSLIATLDGVSVRHYPDAEGGFSFRLPVGDHNLKFEDIGRADVEKQVSVKRDGTIEFDLTVPKAALVKMAITDSAGRPLPAKVQFIGVVGTETPNFGTDYRAHGGNHQYQTHDGRVTQQVPPGNYLMVVSRGPEYDVVERQITVAQGQTLSVDATLNRTVDTTGWISTDYHAHSTPSGDNYCNTDDRIINFVAENIEFAPTTEHQRLYDWEPHIERLGMSRHIKTVPGVELSGSGPHFNAFPFTPDPFSQNGGAPLWRYDPRIDAIVLRNWGTPTLDGFTRIDRRANAYRRSEYFGGGEDRWVQMNHPNVGNFFFDRNQDGIRDGGFVGLEDLIDAAEFWSDQILNLSPNSGNGRRANRTFGWLQMLNQGRHAWCVAVSDAHRVFGNGVGGWRTYVPSSSDIPGDIDYAEIIRNSKAGRMMITNGPFLKVTTGDGSPIGSRVISEGHIDLNIQVQTPNWLEIDRVQVLVSGRQPDEYNFLKDVNPEMFTDGPVSFEKTVRIALQQDEHLIVVATGEKSTIEKTWGLNPYGRMHPMAYTNPIYVDVDRNGFQANGDTLGHPLMTSPPRPRTD